MESEAPDPSQSFLPTRQSLLSRLRDWENHDSWRQFFDTYWRLIYDLARQSGLSEAAAQDVVQETVLAAARQLPEFRYDPKRGSFKAWLRLLTRRRIVDALRQQYRHGQHQEPSDSPKDDTDAEHVFEVKWDAEWQSHLASAALDRVKKRANPLHFQVFDLLAVQGWAPSDVAKTLKVNLAQVYLIRSRLRRMVREELETLEKEGI
ncbi:MAG TPA: sigma-70 family RNA polymerase sigma factor [Candidatus Limnocylindria bacterium]|nr:sigma-70 family RNA polymerase sigma factor [Candidatus Limnocylindria bacterium]